MLLLMLFGPRDARRCVQGVGMTLFVVAFVTTQETPQARSFDNTIDQVGQGTVGTAGKTGAELYRDACAACHGLDGAGKEAPELGFDVPTPDFTDCRFAPREANADWVTVAHEGGPVRGFSRHMPAFGGAFGEADLYKIVEHLKTFCMAP